LFNKNSTEYLTGYFGKLPEFNDFIKFNSASPEITFIDNWLQEGLSYTKLKYKSEWKAKYETLPPTNFFIPVPSSEKFAAGMIYASKDKSNRDFPFIIFSIIPSKQLDEFHLIPNELDQVIKTLDCHLRKEEDLLSLNNTLKTYSINLSEGNSLKNNFHQYLSHTQIAEFFRRTKLNNLSGNIKEMIYTDSTFLKISFSSDELHFCNDAGFIIYLLTKKMNFTIQHSSLFWNMKNDEQFQILIFPFKLSPINFSDLISLGNEDKRRIELNNSDEYHEDNSIDESVSLLEYLKNF
jgi:type VI secretion system ImpM family protein